MEFSRGFFMPLRTNGAAGNARALPARRHVRDSSKSTGDSDERSYRLTYGCWPCAVMQVPYAAN